MEARGWAASPRIRTCGLAVLTHSGEVAVGQTTHLAAPVGVYELTGTGPLPLAVRREP